jgi:hypothetical protein
LCAYVPGLQAIHGVLGLLSLSAVPAGHAEHIVAKASENSPAVHGLHGVDDLISVSAVPAAHAPQVVAPEPA